jgi:beta-glucuronidase
MFRISSLINGELIDSFGGNKYMKQSLLYPVNNSARTSIKLDGLWHFAFDPEGDGESKGWIQALPSFVLMPVPGSFQDVFTDKECRDYCGDFWYETEFFVPQNADNREVWLHFGSITHRGTVYVNGKECGSHEGGFLPFELNITSAVKQGEMNHLSIKANNELSEKTLPCGMVKQLMNGRKIAAPYFDFFNYAGIHRSVYLMQRPQEYVLDYDTNFVLQGKDALVQYRVETSGKRAVHVILQDAQANTVAEADGKENTLEVKDAHLWKVRNAYLYTLIIQIKEEEKIMDEYRSRIGIRTVKVEGTKILVNEEPVYLKGFGKHEDFNLLGRAFNYSVAKRDFECMKWTNANCFRTSHYPYADEWYSFADEEGFLIIDEIPAVGMMRSTRNFAKAGRGDFTAFFQTDTVEQLLANHLRQEEEMIQRDKNHPSVIAFSLFNEPETTSKEAHEYFKTVFDHARTLDMQKRPLTGALEKNSAPELCQVYMFCDFICLNRYYGWYISGGAEIEDAELKFRDEMDRWQKKNIQKPFIFTEFGTDTLSGQHNLPGIMWSEEYQQTYYEMNFAVFDSYDFVQGELTWNFADFATSEGIMRVNGNKKGVFTRERQPKSSAYLLRKRWEKM